MTDEAPSSLDTYSIPAFCKAHSLEEHQLFGLWAISLGPRIVRLDGGRIFITREAAAEWRREMERRTPQVFEDKHRQRRQERGGSG